MLVAGKKHTISILLACNKYILRHLGLIVGPSISSFLNSVITISFGIVLLSLCLKNILRKLVNLLKSPSKSSESREACCVFRDVRSYTNRSNIVGVFFFRHCMIGRCQPEGVEQNRHQAAMTQIHRRYSNRK